MLILDAFCKANIGKKVFSFIGQIFDIIMIVIPIILILMGTIDFIKAVISHKDDEMKKAQNTFIKRIIIGVAVFFVPTLVNVLTGLVGQENKNLCMTCFNNPKDSSCVVTNDNTDNDNNKDNNNSNDDDNNNNNSENNNTSVVDNENENTNEYKEELLSQM